MNTLHASRVHSLDVLKGTAMIIMALDHVRDYFHKDSFLFDPTDLSKTNIVLFFTRWVTHFCAPVFVLLAGTSAFLSGRKKSKKELALFLFKRGAWLIFLDVVVVNFAWYFDVHFRTISLGVIWAIGISMICLVPFVFLKNKYTLFVGLLLIITHNLADNFHISGNHVSAFLWDILHERKSVTFFNTQIKSSYPIIPWVGVMLVGYCMGDIFKTGFNPIKRKRILLFTGMCAIIIFIILRAINIYGNATPWSRQPSVSFSVLSFLNLTKYPPSLDYLLVTLGIALLFLAFADQHSGALSKIVTVYGETPLFYYIIHLYIIHTAAMLAAQLTGFGYMAMVSIQKSVHEVSALKGFGFNLPETYLIWLVLVIIMYPLCKNYGRYKRLHKEKWWLSYL